MSLTGGSLRAAALGVAAVAGIALARPPSIVAVDQEQPRLDVAAPIPQGEFEISQSFTAAHDGLSAVEVLAAVYPAPEGAEPPILALALFDARGRQLASTQFRNVEHNAPLRLTFAPLPDSAGGTYTLTIEALSGSNATVWAYSLDGYERGTLLAGGAPAPGDLRFSTSYTLTWRETALALAAGLGGLARLLLPLWLLMFAPGLLALEAAPALEAFGATRWARWGIALGLSLALLPLAWLWATTVGLHWSAVSLGAAYAVLGLAWLVLFVRRLTRRRASNSKPGTNIGLHDGAMAVILIASLATRLLAVRDLALPPWVDSPHHALIAGLMAGSGRVPLNYAPALPIDLFTYHFGYHALATSAAWLSGASVTDQMLRLGQVLNALAPLAVYPLAAGLTGRPRAGLVAAFIVGLVSLFPGFYLAWGRYSQLTGLLILAPAMAAIWSLSVKPEGSPRLGVVVAAILAAGLILTHYRLLVFFALFALTVTIFSLRRRWLGPRLLAAGGLCLLLALPWLLRLAAETLPALAAAPRSLAAAAGYNTFPVEYFTGPLERAWIALALLAALWGLLRRDRVVAVICAWVALTFALLNLGPGTWLVNNNAWAITLFLPAAVVVGWGVAGIAEIGDWRFGGRGAREQGRTEEGTEASSQGLGVRGYQIPLGAVLSLLLAAGAGFAAVRGGRDQIEIVPAVTVLATADDVRALEWIEANTSPDSVFLVNGWPWLANAWASPDAGAWLWPLAGRRSTLPPVDYTFDVELTQAVNAFYTSAPAVIEADPQGEAAHALLREAGVTHVFIGAKGGTFKPEWFFDSPRYRLVYSNGAAWVFEVEGS